MTRTPLILVVEDEPELSSLVCDYLQNDGFATETVFDGIAALSWLNAHNADLIVLDLMLPKLGGIEVCRKIRESSAIPVIMATAKIDEIDRIIGLEIGADDYICKPYSPRELVARVKSILRRCQPEQHETTLVQLAPETLTLTVQNTKIVLTQIEFSLFELLHSSPGKIFSRRYIMDNIYSDYRIVSDRTVDSHIKKLRKKIQESQADAQLIHSIYGAGYKFEYQTTA